MGFIYILGNMKNQHKSEGKETDCNHQFLKVPPWKEKPEYLKETYNYVCVRCKKLFKVSDNGSIEVYKVGIYEQG